MTPFLCIGSDERTFRMTIEVVSNAIFADCLIIASV